MQDKIFVIIVTYKGHLWYERCFTSLRKSSIPVQVVVVDNASNDGTCEYIKEKFPEIHLIESPENLGFGRANNIGIRYALENLCDYVFLLNQDAWIEENTLVELINVHKKNPEYGLLSPMHLNVDKSQLMMKRFSAQPVNGKLISDLYLNKIADLYDTTYVHAAAWLLSKELLMAVGGFDPIFFHYGEDDNYLNRVVYHGFKIGVCPKSQIIHDHRESKIFNTEYRRMASILVDWTNINSQFSAFRIKSYYVKKIILNIFCFNLKNAKSLYKMLIYCHKKTKAINFSREENIQRKNSWI